jgi:osmoprotectant transport system substrate-binding protein
VDLSGASFTVGSKEFTEQKVLGQIAVQALQAAGADVKDLATITGSTNVRTALTSGQIDMYWEYTGTGWTTHLQHEPASAAKDPAQLFQAVKDEDQKNQIHWLDPAPLNNSYAIAVAADRDQGVTTMSEYAALVARDPAVAKMCAAAEFLTRDDGFPGIEKTYGFDLPAGSLVELELSLIPQQVGSGENCNFGEVTTTDGAVASNKLKIIDDDKKFFVNYNAAMTIRQEVFDKNPKLAEVFDPISKALTTEVVRGLNEKVDVGGELEDDVAEQFLKDNGFVS